MREQDIPGGGVDRASHFTEHFLQILAMTGRGAIIGDDVNGAGGLRGIASRPNAFVNSAQKRPPTKVSVDAIPLQQFAAAGVIALPLSIDRGFGADVLDRREIPGIAVLVAQDRLPWRRMIRIRLLHPILQFNWLCRGGFHDEDVIDIGSFRRRAVSTAPARLLRFRDTRQSRRMSASIARGAFD